VKVIDAAFVHVLQRQGYVNVTLQNALEYKVGMKFDVVIGNPPYNSSAESENTIAGTSGNTTFYRKFIKLAHALSKEYTLMVVQRAGIRYAHKLFPHLSYVLDTSRHWDYTAGYFLARPQGPSFESLDSNPILAKVYDMAQEKPFVAAIGGGFKSNLAAGKISTQLGLGPEGIIELPNSASSEPIRGSILVGTPTPARPKLMFKGLESRLSYYVTDELSYVGSGCALWFDTLEEAQKARLFVLNSPLVRYLYDLLVEKASGYVLRYLKPFDYNQIVTGYEYPKEFSLTPEEIAYIESKVK
jgi:hypothetical protein